MTPTTAKYPSDNQKQLSTSIGNTKRNSASTQADVPATPAKPFQSTASRQRNQNSGSALPNVFGNRNSESKSSTSHISPRTLDKERGGRNRLLAAADGTPGRGRSIPPFDQTKYNVSSETTKKLPTEGRGRRIVATTRKASPASPNHRKISDKIEQLYRAKSLERNDEKLRDAAEKKERVHNVFSSPKNIKPIGQGCTTRETKLENSLRATPSKVADMKKIFDRGNALEAKAPIERLPPCRLVFSTIPGLAKYEKSRVGLPLLSPPILDPLPQVKPKRSSVISPKSMKENLATVTEVKPPAPVNIGTFQRIYPRKKESKPKSLIIGEKIKLFESIRECRQTAEPQKVKNSFTRKIRSSMQTLVEAQSNRVVDKEQSAGGDKGVSGRGVKNFVEEIEVEKLSAGTKVGKRGTMGGRRSMMPKVPAASGGDGTMSDAIGSTGMEAVRMMVIKEAECGLKQPKPLRVVEMKRMMALCRRDRIGGMMDKEKGCIVLTRKL
jgi:hypothetical protein